MRFAFQAEYVPAQVVEPGDNGTRIPIRHNARSEVVDPTECSRTIASSSLSIPRIQSDEEATIFAGRSHFIRIHRISFTFVFSNVNNENIRVSFA